MTTTPTDPEELAFIRSIATHPHEDTPRLAFADWLDEKGTKGARARAQFIRWGYECGDDPYRPGVAQKYGWCVKAFNRSWSEWFWTPTSRLTNEFRTRRNYSVTVPGGHRARLTDPCTILVRDWRRESNTYRDKRYSPAAVRHNWFGSDQRCYYRVRRGFVEQLDVHWHHLRDYWQDLRQWHPVRKIKLLTVPIVQANEFVVPLLPELQAALPTVEWDLSDVGANSVVAYDRVSDLTAKLGDLT